MENLNKEINLIKSLDIRMFAEEMIKEVPDYFWTIPASSTSKYHPQYALGDGGLVRHTKAAIRIAIELFGVECEGGRFSQRNKDIIICSLIFHDCFKSGYPKQDYTVTEHPLLAAKFLQDNYKGNLDIATFSTICSCIKTHMGQWNIDYKTRQEVLPKPEREVEHFVHLCDYLASRKCIEINFNAEVRY